MKRQILDLKSIMPIKTVKIGRKTVKIPKLSLRHHKLLNTVRDVDVNMKILIDSIHKGLTPAESLIVCVHLMAFNGRIKNEVTLDGNTFKVDDIFISQKLKFHSGGKDYLFKSPEIFNNLTDAENILTECYLGEPIDFNSMPAYVINWARDITTMISVTSDKGLTVGGLAAILELFEGTLNG
ncbi:baseplate hub distal subunit [Shewanella phage Thanatos-1]|nr:baseplate hub distal subunit [Shewanella phage Thanatos-1]QLA10595.1 baseplate hub distal subunit [Shewanella phage Thanatos-2]